jgi:mannose-6-phosphate isomerase-like protein (cupin superfamily)
MAVEGRPFIIRPGEELPGWTARRPVNIVATAALTGGALGAFENVDPPATSTTLHSHPSSESFYILDGSFEFYVGGTWIDASAGSFLFVPGGVPHGFRVGSAGGRKLVLFVPGGDEGLFAEARSLHDADAATPEAIAELQQRYGLTRLGALPERD